MVRVEHGSTDVPAWNELSGERPACRTYQPTPRLGVRRGVVGVVHRVVGVLHIHGGGDPLIVPTRTMSHEFGESQGEGGPDRVLAGDGLGLGEIWKGPKISTSVPAMYSLVPCVPPLVPCVPPPSTLCTTPSALCTTPAP